MNPQIRQQVRDALNLEWESFASRHPNLARVMDQEAIVEDLATHLADDPDYQKAISAADRAGAAIEGASTLRPLIQSWLARLFRSV